VWSNNIIKVASEVVDSEVVDSEDRPKWYALWIADGWATNGPQTTGN